MKSKLDCLMEYIDYVDSQIDAGLMPSKFIVWFEHDFNCTTNKCENEG